jgi:hypothetical protein
MRGREATLPPCCTAYRLKPRQQYAEIAWAQAATRECIGLAVGLWRCWANTSSDRWADDSGTRTWLGGGYALVILGQCRDTGKWPHRVISPHFPSCFGPLQGLSRLTPLNNPLHPTSNLHLNILTNVIAHRQQHRPKQQIPASSPL